MKAHSLLQQRLDEAAIRLEKELPAPVLYGLFAGKTGAAWCYFQLAGSYRAAGNKATGQQLIHEILSALPEVKDTSLANGLAGIGWGLEIMRRNGYKVPDMQEALAFIDDQLYKYTLFRKTADLSLANGLLGYLGYLTTRLAPAAEGLCRYRSLLLQECITLLISDLQTAVFTADASTQADCLIFFQRLREQGWYPDRSKNLLQSLRWHIERRYADADPATCTVEDTHRLRAYAWLAAQTRTPGMQHQVAVWEKRFGKKLYLADKREATPACFTKKLPFWPGFSLEIPAKEGEVRLADSCLLI